MTEELPRILLIADASLNQDSGGINRTLVNLFKDYPSDRLMLLAPNTLLNSNPPDKSVARNFLGFRTTFFPLWHNRLGKFFNPLFRLLNFQLTDWLPIFYRKEIDTFDPAIILICPVGISTLLYAYKMIQQINCPYLVYVLDDWSMLDDASWLTGFGKDLIYKLLAQAKGWLVISEPLKNSLCKNYQLNPQHVEVVHNSVDLGKRGLIDFSPRQSEIFRIAFAGSVWPIHYDAVTAVAEAVYQLRQEGVAIEMLLHTERNFWELYQDQWVAWQVVYSPYIPYDQLAAYLSEQADLLLVASSFLPEYECLTRGSLQTKVIDYMATGRAILACGPSYSICNQFIQLWNCGIVCETNKAPEIKETLVQHIRNRHLNSKIAETAFNILRDNFEVKVTSTRFYDFIYRMAKEMRV